MANSTMHPQNRDWKNVHAWISDLAALNSNADSSNAIKTGNVMGTVVKVWAPSDIKTSNKPVGYYIDDGTGVVKVSFLDFSR